MKILIATEKDARLVSENNIRLAKETENIIISEQTAFKGVINVVNDNL